MILSRTYEDNAYIHDPDGRSPKFLPFMVYADPEGRIYDHPYYKMAGFSGPSPVPLSQEDLVRLPKLSKLFYLPQCPPMGLNPETGVYETVPEVRIRGVKTPIHAVAAFPEAGWVRTHLPAADYSSKAYTLPMWAYTAVGFRDDAYWTAAFQIEYNERWDPQNYDDRKLLPRIRRLQGKGQPGPLLTHLMSCAVNNHCFAAKNLFLKRWEAPLPVSRKCNAACLGCLSLQPSSSCEASHHRIAFRPSKEEVVAIAVDHLNLGTRPIVSFGQGCEGEPLTEYRLIADSILEMRRLTGNGTINLNTNGSWPERVRLVAESGLDSIRISLNSARPEIYRAYYRPKTYGFEDVVESISLCREMGLYTMINYLVFPGITDLEEEVEAFVGLIRKTGLHFVHLKNLCIDPCLYLKGMSGSRAGKSGSARLRGKPIGIRTMVEILRQEFPNLELGYFNQPVR